MSAHHVLVGSGIAALSAAEEIRRRDAHARITMLGPEPDAVYSRPGLPYFLDGTIPEARLAIRSPAELKELELDRIHDQATSLDTAAHTLTLGGGRTVRYDRLLLATGAASIEASFPGAGFEGVFRLDSLADARAIAQAARPGRTAVVVGGGSTALELVEALAARGVHTHYLLRGDRYWARVLDPVESRMVEQRLEAHGVVLHRRTEVARVVPSEVRGGLSRYSHLWSDAPRAPAPYRTRVAGVETRTGERIACDMLCVAVGIRPRLALAVAGGLSTERGILTDEYLRTSAPDVFAAGDVAQARDPLTGEALLDTLWSSAARQGRLAGANMTGAREPDARPVALNVTRLAGLTTTIVGAVEGGSDDPDLVTLTRGQSERWHAEPDAWTLNGRGGADRVRVILSRDAIVGAVVMGDQRLSRPLAQLVAARADVSALRPALVARPDALVPLLLEFHRVWEAEHASRA